MKQHSPLFLTRSAALTVTYGAYTQAYSILRRYIARGGLRVRNRARVSLTPARRQRKSRSARVKTRSFMVRNVPRDNDCSRGGYVDRLGRQ